MGAVRGVVAVSAECEYMGSTRASGLVSTSNGVLEMSVVRSVGGVCTMCIRKQVFPFLDQKGCLNSTQHGFRHGRSFLSALLDVFNNSMHMLDSNCCCHQGYLSCINKVTIDGVR